MIKVYVNMDANLRPHLYHAKRVENREMGDRAAEDGAASAKRRLAQCNAIIGRAPSRTSSAGGYFGFGLNADDSTPYFFISLWKFWRVIFDAFAAAVTLPWKTDN